MEEVGREGGTLTLDILVLQMENRERVYQLGRLLRCVVVYCLTGGGHNFM